MGGRSKNTRFLKGIGDDILRLWVTSINYPLTDSDVYDGLSLKRDELTEFLVFIV